MKYSSFLKHERALFWLVFVTGVTACTVDGIGRTETYGWLHPISLGGAILGSAALILGANVLFRGRLSDRASLIALLGIIVAKVILAQLYALSI